MKKPLLMAAPLISGALMGLSPSPTASPTPLASPALERLRSKIESVRSDLRAEALAADESSESGWWNLISRRRKEMRLRRLRELQLRLEGLQAELEDLKKP
jgi:hypothetical protein